MVSGRRTSRIPLPLAEDTSLLLGLSLGDALVLATGLTVSLAVLAPHQWTRWPLACTVVGVSGALLWRVHDDPLWLLAGLMVRHHVAARHYRFDITSEVSHHAFTHETALSHPGYRRRHVPDGP
jgi:hypothetical protein